jgi:hypothetical protein
VSDRPADHGEAQSVAALAVQVAGLRRELASLTSKVDILAATQQEHALVLDSISELRHQIERILSLLAEDEAPPSEWFWLTMNDQARSDKFAELSDWVGTVLRTQYADYLQDQIQPCWPNHPEARWELTWLYQLWSAAYLTKRPAPKDAADWHDRWCPGVIRRLCTVMSRCEKTCQQQPGFTTVSNSR